ncbi:mannonate dehydratase [Thioclava dalianensis]|uniref:mannonate dehydratase n=1 Tax=Thioclava dalianensis TaxID=1185766 RepID=A0A074TIZ2_9RHOB|nr:mannonate dehydratase [Thioclava dalianensis]KEP68983.1 mannonate dehydratase [Thioclava dalianensis]SFN73133.1 mannonate dehydratase [Thioclava dalianensis]
MYLGTQLPARHDDDYRVMRQLGVTHVSATPEGDWRGWDRPLLEAFREKIESFGLVLDMTQLPMPSRRVDHDVPCPEILLAGPDRDKQIDGICRLIENCGAAGIPAVRYNFNYIGIPRTPMEPGRGGYSSEAWRTDLADLQAPAPEGVGVLEEDEIWERIGYFLARVVPVAETAQVRLACHPHDPATPPGYMGVTRVLGTVEGMKRFVSLHESPIHGLNFCIGTLAEMLEDVREVPDVTRWFGERGKLMNIHFRNIVGKRYSFRESFPEEGDVDMPAVIDVLRETAYKYMVMPDHMPTLSGENQQQVAFSYCYGYIAALLQTR